MRRSWRTWTVIPAWISAAARDWAELLRDDIASHARDRAGRVDERQPSPLPVALVQRLEALAGTAEQLCEEMDFGFLYDPERQLFVLGYRVAEGQLDDSYYDLLASEARLTSLVAIAKRDVNSSHWFHLGRQMTRAARDTVLLSWSGSMFEYLMPSLVSFTPRYSLVDQTCRGVVRRQISYGRERGVPWGISESAFNQRDLEFTYQYSAFGVPGLGLKRGLAEDLVIAPYATALAAMYLPQAAARNFAHLVRAGALGRYGLYEALDYTAERLAEGQPVAIVRCYMAHHQGMSLVALDNVIHDGVMRHRFHGIPRVQATDLLLQERNPRGADTRGPRVIKVHTAAQVMVLAPVRRALPDLGGALHPVAVQWPLCGDGHGRGRRLQHLGGAGGDPLAGRQDAGRPRQLPLSAGPDERAGVVRRLSAHPGGPGPLRGRLSGGPGTHHPHRWGHRQQVGDPGFSGE